MIKGSLSRRYARALFEIAVETSLDQVDKDLRELTTIVGGNIEVKRALQHPHISPRQKKAMMDKLMGDGFGEVTRKFFHLLIDRNRENFLSSIHYEFCRLADEARQIVEAKVTSAVELNETQIEGLKQSIKQVTKKDVRLVRNVQADLIGGVRIQIGDRLMDGSVTHALAKIRAELRKDAMTSGSRGEIAG